MNEGLAVDISNLINGKVYFLDVILIALIRVSNQKMEEKRKKRLW